MFFFLKFINYLVPDCQGRTVMKHIEDIYDRV